VCVCVMDLFSSGDWSVADSSEHKNEPFRFHKRHQNFSTAEILLTFEKGLCIL
jgi:hypothetical protein